MTPEQLKVSILQYAIQGKLVEQRPEEGSAEELYQQIQKEKQRLIKEGKIKKEKPLAEITEDEIPFDIPESWKWVKLGELIKVQNGYAYKTEEMNKDSIGMPVIKSGNLMSLKVKLKPRNDYIKEPNEKMLDSKIIKGDMLMCLSSQSNNPEPLGKTAIYENNEPALLNQRVLKMRPYIEKLTKYLYYTINSHYFHYTVSHQGGGSAQANLKMNTVLNMIIPLPPLEEQHRIVAKIEELLSFVERYAKSYEKLNKLNVQFPEDMKKSILQYAIQGKLVEQRPEEGNAEELYKQIQEEKQRLIKEGKIKKEKPLAEITEDEIPFDIPESWKWVRVRSIGITQTGNTPKKSHLEYFGSDIPFLGPGDIQNGIINYNNQGLSIEGKKYGRITPINSILQVCIGGSIGKCAIVNREVTFNQQINSIYPILVDYKYVYYVLDSNYFKEYMKENAGGTATPIINRGLWDAIIIPLPPIEEQHRIVAKIEELLPYCDQLIK